MEVLPAVPEPRHATPRDAPRLDDFHRAVLGWLAEYTPRTRESYARDIQLLADFLTSRNINPLHAQRPHIALWARHMTETGGYAPGTVARRIAAASSFYTWCCRADILTTNPAQHVRRPSPTAVRATHGLTEPELHAILDAAREDSPVAYCLVALLSLAALRVSEACAVRVTDLEVVDGVRVVRVLGKGGKRANVPLIPAAARAIDTLIASRREQPASREITERSGDAPRAGGPPLLGLDRHQAYRIVVRLARRAGIEHRVSPHSGRRAACTLALDAGAPLRDVQIMMRHSSPTTTTGYDRGRRDLRNRAVRALDDLMGE